MKVLVILATVSAIIAGTFAQTETTPNVVDWDLVQGSLNDTIFFIHNQIDRVGKLATAVNPVIGKLVAESLKTSLDTTIDPLLTQLVNAAMNEELTEKALLEQREVLRKLLSDAYQKLLRIIDPLSPGTIQQIFQAFTDLDKWVVDDVNTIISYL